MMLECDLCVVGAGMFGSAAARHASTNPTLKVVLVGPDEPKTEDYKAQEVFSCHYDEGRITRVLDENFVYEELSKKSIARYTELEKLSGIDFFNPIGCLMMGKEDSDILVRLRKEAAVANYSYLALSEDHINVRYPYFKIRPNEKAFLDENGAGYICARKMVKAQKQVALQQGCVIVDDTVKEILPLRDTDIGVFHEVITAKGEIIYAKRVLVCAGAFTKYKPLIPHQKNWIPKCKTTEESAVLLKIPEGEAKRLCSMPSVIYHTFEFTQEEDPINVYILPPIKYPDNKYYLKIGHIAPSRELKTLQELQKWYCSKGYPDFIRRHSNRLIDMLPNLKVEEIKSLTCVCCDTPHGNPYIERVTPTLSVAFCGNGKGAKISDEVGRIASELSVNGKWDSTIPKHLFEVFWSK